MRLVPKIVTSESNSRATALPSDHHRCVNVLLIQLIPRKGQVPSRDSLGLVYTTECSGRLEDLQGNTHAFLKSKRKLYFPGRPSCAALCITTCRMRRSRSSSRLFRPQAKEPRMTTGDKRRPPKRPSLRSTIVRASTATTSEQISSLTAWVATRSLSDSSSGIEDN